MVNDYTKLNLFKHNQIIYEKVQSAFSTGEDVVGIVQATGTGKSYIGLQLALDNPNKKIVYCVPYQSIIEHLKSIISENGLEEEFRHVEFRNYSSFVPMNTLEIQNMNADLLILDEFHHLGAPVWGCRIEKVIETHPNLKIFGMTAYTVRDRGTPYERDMALPDGDELFSSHIVSNYDLADAIIDGILPKPIYISAYTKLMPLVQYLENKLEQGKYSNQDYKLFDKLLKDAKKRILESNEAKDLLLKNIKLGDKYFFFCPPFSENGVNDIDTITENITSWFLEQYSLDDFVVYKTTSKDKNGKRNRDAFYHDKTLDGRDAKEKIKIMVAINQYNEGVHAPNVTGSVLGRGTSSDIVFFEQLGRAMTAQALLRNRKKLSSLSKEELLELYHEQGFNDGNDLSKEALLEQICAPKIIDLAGNIEFIKELETDVKNRIKEIQNSKNGRSREIHITNPSFEIEIQNQDLFDILIYLKERLAYPTWDFMYSLAEKYYETYGNLDMPKKFNTLDGSTYDMYGQKLGSWIQGQRQAYQNRILPKEKRKTKRLPLSDERVEKLERIGMIWDIKKYQWDFMYSLAKKYYECYGHLNIPASFKTSDGIHEDEHGKNLGRWISKQRKSYQNRFVPKKQRNNIYLPLSDEQVKKLEQIGMIWNIRKYQWDFMYSLAEKYYNTYGNLNVSQDYKTADGFFLGGWISEQRKSYSKQKISEERRNKLEAIEMIWNTKEYQWDLMHSLAKKYYEFYGHLNIPTHFKTMDGIHEDEQGKKLGMWISEHRKDYKTDFSGNEKMRILMNIRKPKLEAIGMIWDTRENKIQAKELCAEHQLDYKKNKLLLSLPYRELQAKINFLLDKEIPLIEQDNLHPLFFMSEASMIENYHITKEEMLKIYDNEKRR